MKTNTTLKSTVFGLGLMLCLILPQAGQCFYNPSSGRWLSRDPAEEAGGMNNYGFVKNDPINQNDAVGLWATQVHHDIVNRWLDTSYEHYKWRCCTINVRALIKNGSDIVDGVFSCGFPSTGFPAAQSSANAYQHGMSSPPDSDQSKQLAEHAYWQFITDKEVSAIFLAETARTTGDCGTIKNALILLGQGYHSYSDSLSPAHSGFQTWYGPVDGIKHFGLPGYLDYLHTHSQQKTPAAYSAMAGSVNDAVVSEFGSVLDSILRP